MGTFKTVFLLLFVSIQANALDMEQLAGPISQLKKLASHPMIVQTVSSNLEPLSIKDMLAIDRNWYANSNLPSELLDPEVQILFQHMMNKPKRLFVELILMGAYGQTLAASPLTSDYWQGDELKFTKTMSRQNVYVGEVDWDESTRTISAQISVPVWVDGDVLGVLTGAVEANLETLSNTEVVNP